MASEMLYPIMPIYLKSIGFSIVLIGILEGFAEAIAGLSKGYFGKLSDLSGKRVPFVRVGFALSALSKPLMAFLVQPMWVFAVRTIDRVGKGVRTGARDAILSDQSTAENKGKVFGFHRSMDTFGAVIGPALALLYLYYNPSDYKTLFILALLPGVLAVLATLLLKETFTVPKEAAVKQSAFSFLTYLKSAPKAYRQLLVGLLLFALFNSSDVFLLLRAKEAGLDDTSVIGVYIFYNLVYALCAFPIGILADRWGLKAIFLVGLGLFVVVYVGMSFELNLVGCLALFACYGVYGAATEGVSKAWISNIAPRHETATAIGTYAALQSLCALLASTVTGYLWYQFGATTAFLTTAVVTVVALVYLLSLPYSTRKTLAEQT